MDANVSVALWGIVISATGVVVTAGVTYYSAMRGVKATIQATQDMNQVAAQGHKNRLILAIQRELKDLESLLARTPTLSLPPLDVADAAVFEDTVADQTRLFSNVELLNECHVLRAHLKKLNLLQGIGATRHIHNQDSLTQAIQSHWPGASEKCQESIAKIKPLLAAENGGPSGSSPPRDV